MAEFKLIKYMPGPIGKQMIFTETETPYFSGYVSNGKNKIKLRCPFEQIGKNGLYDYLVEEGRVSEEDINTIFKSE